MTFSQTYRIYEIFNSYFKNEEDAKTLTSEIEELINGRVVSDRADLATKSDIAQLRVETKADIAQLRSETKTEIKQLELRMEQGFRDNLKWTVTTMVGIAAIMLAIIKLS